MRILYSPLVATVITIIAGILCVSLYINALRIRQSSTSVAKLEQEVSLIEEKVSAIEGKAQVATSSTEKERLFREELLLQKPNEYIVQIPDLPIPSPSPILQPIAERPWVQWKKLLTN
jgi:hypothetical protein